MSLTFKDTYIYIISIKKFMVLMLTFWTIVTSGY